jgi:hypothetical protein
VRRGGAPPMLAVDPAVAPACARVERGPRGLKLVAAAPPEGISAAPGDDLILESAAPVALRAGALVATGTQVLGLGALGGVAYSIAVPRVRVVHDRRPPGVDAIAGAASVNAGLLHGDDGWRAVVLQSLGDVAADLGEGPVALRADGRLLAVAADGGVYEVRLGTDEQPVHHPGAADAVAYSGDGALWVAAGAVVGPVGTVAADGPAVIALAGAAAAAVIAALHADGTVTVWRSGADAPIARWSAPCPGAGALAVSADGERVEIGVPVGDSPAACIARAADGALVRRVAGARVIAATPDQDGLFIAGDWGCAWLITIPEPTE